jgi:hypothetical protein
MTTIQRAISSGPAPVDLMMAGMRPSAERSLEENQGRSDITVTQLFEAARV